VPYDGAFRDTMANTLKLKRGIEIVFATEEIYRWRKNPSMDDINQLSASFRTLLLVLV
jgi:hypothetical protein